MTEKPPIKLTDGYDWQKTLLNFRKKYSNFSQADDFSNIVNSWKDILKNDFLAKNSKPEKILEDVLIVSCRSSAVLAELMRKKPLILPSCIALTKSRKLKDVKFIKK